jgi:hypothetical protein
VDAKPNAPPPQTNSGKSTSEKLFLSIWSSDCSLCALVGEENKMIVATGLAVLVIFCLLLSMVQTPPPVGR